MGRSQPWVAMLVLLALVVGVARSDTVTLKGGHQVTGEVLKSDEDVVIVDLGCAVLRLPKAEIVGIVTDGEKSPATGRASTKPAGATAEAPVETDAPQWQLYRTAKLKPATIEENSQRIGEAVIMVTSPGGQGSGFVITPDGYCITNYHVIARETRIKVTVFHRTKTGYEQKHYKKVKIVAINPAVDLALLKIDGQGDALQYVYIGTMSELQVGQEVFAIGNPLGLTRTVSQGIVSTKNRNFQGLLYIQTTADINPGNSGGPLFNLKGEVIGVTSMGYIYLGGLNFAIPVDVVKWFVANRDAFAYDQDNPNTGYRYLQPAGRQRKGPPPPAKPPTVRTDEKPQATKPKPDA